MNPVWFLIIAVLYIAAWKGLPLLNRATRNNNPGNLRFAGQAGATHKDDSGFAVFDTAQSGWTALLKQISLDASRGHTLESFINKYAPPTENPTVSYLAFLMEKTGASAGTPLAKVDFISLSKAIAKFEGYQGEYIA